MAPSSPPPPLLPLLLLLLPLLLLVAAASGAAAGAGRRSKQIVGELNTNYPKHDMREFLGAVSGVAIGKDGVTFVFHRAGRTWGPDDFDEQNRYRGIRWGPIEAAAIVPMSYSGRSLGAFAENTFYLPHGLTVDSEDNIWATDVGMHQAVRINRRTGEIDMRLGEKFVPGSDARHFCQPTKVVVASSGEIFVADGYCNNRVVKFDKTGKFLGQFGEKPAATGKPQPNQLLIPHGLSLDEANDRLCVADREHRRVQCFAAGLADAAAFGDFQLTLGGELGRVFDVHFLNSDALLVLHETNGTTKVTIRNPNSGADVGELNYVPPKRVRSRLEEMEKAPSVGLHGGHAVVASPRGTFALIGSLDAVCDTERLFCDLGMRTRNHLLRFEMKTVGQ